MKGLATNCFAMAFEMSGGWVEVVEESLKKHIVKKRRKKGRCELHGELLTWASFCVKGWWKRKEIKNLWEFWKFRNLSFVYEKYENWKLNETQASFNENNWNIDGKYRKWRISEKSIEKLTKWTELNINEEYVKTKRLKTVK